MSESGSVRKPSKLFLRYVRDRPDSGIAKVYERCGDGFLGVGGSFGRALWKGQVMGAYGCADRGNVEWLVSVLGVSEEKMHWLFWEVPMWTAEALAQDILREVGLKDD